MTENTINLKKEYIPENNRELSGFRTIKIHKEPRVLIHAKAKTGVFGFVFGDFGLMNDLI
ncbi:hypothetical protein J8281_07925 [Aquimarina sp. U1-2]|uniref:hypothetical protein n=1 Tax=Aquimarina sp. U1-2 TaxID=2823141 RepID=UPI001AECE665|nr:hypothetical protein [Aquimarina sp. U1-2]MBP2832117.1 hypothetical protein [Aquimarina sp. U1-2]